MCAGTWPIVEKWQQEKHANYPLFIYGVAPNFNKLGRGIPEEHQHIIEADPCIGLTQLLQATKFYAHDIDIVSLQATEFYAIRDRVIAMNVSSEWICLFVFLCFTSLQ